MSHAHEHAAAGRRRLRVALVVALLLLVVELAGAAATGSLALVVDAVHVATDAGGLALALGAASLAARPASARRTWGWARAEVLGATGQAAALGAVGLFSVVEGVRRLIVPPDVPAPGLLAFGAAALALDVVALVVLAGGRHGSLNLRAAFLEVASDAAGALAVLAAGLVIALTGFTRADTVAALLVAALMLPRAALLLRETLDVLLETVPEGLDLDAVRRHMLELPHVRAVHDLHASTIASGLPVLTAHVALDPSCFTDGDIPQILDALQRCALEHFPVSIEHSTFQFEPEHHREHELSAHA